VFLKRHKPNKLYVFCSSPGCGTRFSAPDLCVERMSINDEVWNIVKDVFKKTIPIPVVNI
jgi:hypothetical protein